MENLNQNRSSYRKFVKKILEGDSYFPTYSFFQVKNYSRNIPMAENVK